MEENLEGGMDNVQEHSKKLPRATEIPTPTFLTDAGKVQMQLFEKVWPNVQPLVECRRPECRAVGSLTKAGIARSGPTMKKS